jgi:hypothetical protein
MDRAKEALHPRVALMTDLARAAPHLALAKVALMTDPARAALHRREVVTTDPAREAPRDTLMTTDPAREARRVVVTMDQAREARWAKRRKEKRRK